MQKKTPTITRDIQGPLIPSLSRRPKSAPKIPRPKKQVNGIGASNKLPDRAATSAVNGSGAGHAARPSADASRQRQHAQSTVGTVQPQAPRLGAIDGISSVDRGQRHQLGRDRSLRRDSVLSMAGNFDTDAPTNGTSRVSSTKAQKAGHRQKEPATAQDPATFKRDGNGDGDGSGSGSGNRRGGSFPGRRSGNETSGKPRRTPPKLRRRASFETSP